MVWREAMNMAESAAGGLYGFMKERVMRMGVQNRK